MLIWVVSGPAWGVVFLRWRGRRFSKAFQALGQKLAPKARDRLQRHSGGPLDGAGPEPRAARASADKIATRVIFPYPTGGNMGK